MAAQPGGQDELARLSAENARLQRLTETLMDRVEQATSSANTPFGFFQINAALAEQLTQQQVALRASQQTLQAIFQAAPVGLLLFSDDLTIRSANEAALAMLGRSETDVLGRTLGVAAGCAYALAGECGVAPPCPQCAWRRLLQDTRQAGRAACEHQLARAAAPGAPARDIWLSLKAERVRIGDQPHLVLSLEDISSKKLAERQLREAKDAAEEASRLKSRFLSNVSHEIRTPLNGIMGFAEAILSSPTLEAARQQSQVILRESGLLLMLVNDLLDLVKIESGKLVLERVPVDLAQVLRESSQTAGLQARAKGLRFVATLAIDVPARILSDPLRLRQILLNLVSNAVKFTARGEVRVSVEGVPGAGPPRLRVSVQDTGIGVPPDKQQSIFDSFTQADVSTTRQYGGTGLGLAIVRQLTALLGGEVGVDSTPGKGSTFWFVVPAEPAPAEASGAPAADAAAPAGPARRGRLLVAEDYPTNQEIIRLFLEQAGHQVTVVPNGQEAVAACAAGAFDLVLMDLHMPVMDGQTAAAQIRAGRTPNATVPIVALTASADAQTRAACPEFGMNGVLTKPIRRELLLSAVQRWLAATPPASSPPAPSVPAPSVPAPSASPAPGPEAVAPAPAPPPLDLEVAIREFGGRAVVTRLSTQFLEHAQTHLAALRAALAPVERQALRQAAHALKGAAATLEAAPLARQAAALETASAAAEPAVLQALLHALEAELERLGTYVREALATPEEAEHALPGD